MVGLMVHQVEKCSAGEVVVEPLSLFDQGRKGIHVVFDREVGIMMMTLFFRSYTQPTPTHCLFALLAVPNSARVVTVTSLGRCRSASE